MRPNDLRMHTLDYTLQAGYKPVILERGQPVEVRGRDIGALFARRILNGESNLCYGEGGAGTWSDGKLTTRIGKNSGESAAGAWTCCNPGHLAG
jgi:uncharacterized FAD-dependent dehydrogenase